MDILLAGYILYSGRIGIYGTILKGGKIGIRGKSLLRCIYLCVYKCLDLPGGSAVKNPPAVHEPQETRV